MTGPNAARGRLIGAGAATVVVLAALALRLNMGLARDFWEDEVIAAGNAQQPFWALPVVIMRLDVHPFLYFMQLHAWSLLGDGDVWLRLNSTMWNLAAVALLFVAADRFYGRKQAWIAASLFAVCAPAVWMAQEVRPYSWLFVLLIGEFALIERRYRDGVQTAANGVSIFLVSLCIIYSHALGFFAVFLLGTYAFGRAWAVRQPLVDWLLIFGACAVLAAPPLAVDLLRDANLAVDRDVLADLADWLPRLLMPRGGDTIALVAAGGVWGGTLLAGILARPTRWMALTLVLLPVLIAALLQGFGVGFFKLNVFSTMTTPFFVVVLARLLCLLPPRRAWAGAAVVGLLFAGFSGLFFLYRTPTTGFRAASQLIEAQAEPGDLVYAPQPSMFWGMARYLGVESRGWQLRVAPALSPQWQRMYDRIGPRLVALFRLAPVGQTLVARDGLVLLVGNDSAGVAARARRVWLVTYARADLPDGFPPGHIGLLEPVSARPVGFLEVRLYEAAKDRPPT